MTVAWVALGRLALRYRHERDRLRRELDHEERLHQLARSSNLRLSARVIQLEERVGQLTAASVARDFKPAGRFARWEES